MDNLTHTLVGAALAKSGLERRTALGRITLIIGANFPDIDVIAVPLGRGFEWRRGTTHGFLALAILPFLLAGIMLAADRYGRRKRHPDATPADYRQLVILSAISIATHPTLDFMNTYGMRWLMPFVDRWFYADALFIVDPWILIALIVGVVWSTRAKKDAPAQVALGFTTLYICAMLIITGLGRGAVRDHYATEPFMVAPVPVIPWERTILVEQADGYRSGEYRPHFYRMWPEVAPKENRDPAVPLAKKDPRVQGFLRWARFPYYYVTRDGPTTVVQVMDARYYLQDWASVEVRLPLSP